MSKQQWKTKYPIPLFDKGLAKWSDVLRAINELSAKERNVMFTKFVPPSSGCDAGKIE